MSEVYRSSRQEFRRDLRSKRRYPYGRFAPVRRSPCNRGEPLYAGIAFIQTASWATSVLAPLFHPDLSEPKSQLPYSSRIQPSLSQSDYDRAPITVVEERLPFGAPMRMSRTATQLVAIAITFAIALSNVSASPQSVAPKKCWWGYVPDLTVPNDTHAYNEQCFKTVQAGIDWLRDYAGSNAPTYQSYVGGTGPFSTNLTFVPKNWTNWDTQPSGGDGVRDKYALVHNFGSTYTYNHNCNNGGAPDYTAGYSSGDKNVQIGQPNVPPFFADIANGRNKEPSPAGCNYGKRINFPTFELLQSTSNVFCDAEYTLTNGKCVAQNVLIVERNLGVSCPNLTKHPMNIATGNKFLSETDWSSSGSYLNVRRYYNSQNRDSGHFGSGWTHEYDSRIEINTGGGTTTARVVRPDGRVETFNLNGNAWAPDPNVKGTLTGSTTNGWVYTRPDDTQEAYSTFRQLTSITTREGFVTTLQYTTSGTRLLISVTDPFGRVMTIERDVSERIKAIVMPDGARFEYVYSADNLSRVIMPDTNDVTGNPTTRSDNPYREYLYENTTFPHHITGIVDENGDRYSTYTYDTSGKVFSSELAGGVDRIEATYAPGVTTTKDVLNRVRTHSITPNFGMGDTSGTTGGPSEVCNTSFASRSFDPRGYPDVETDFEGNQVDYSYNTRGLAEETIEAKGSNSQRTTTTVWHQTLRVPTSVTTKDKNGVALQEIASTYSNGRLASRTAKSLDPSFPDEVNRTTSYIYYGDEPNDPVALHKLLKRVDGPRGNSEANDVTQYFYAEDNNNLSLHRVGDLVEIRNGLGQATLILKHDPIGRPLIVRDANGVDTEYVYHPRGWLLQRTIDNKTSVYKYDNAGQLIAQVLPDQSFIRFGYDVAHRIEDVWTGHSYVSETQKTDVEHIHYELDNFGNRVDEQVSVNGGAIQRRIERVIDEQNRLRKEIAHVSSAPPVALETNYRYADSTTTGTSNGDVWRVIDPRDPDPNAPAIYRELQYDALRRVASVRSEDGTITNYLRDPLDNIVSVDPPSVGTTTYEHNGFGELREQHSPDTGTTHYTYDLAGNLKTIDDSRPSAATVYGYDALNRLTVIDNPTAADVTLTYDDDTAGNYGIGRLTGVTDETGTMHYRYDKRGNLVRVTVELSNEAQSTYTVHYGYDDADRLTTITYPSGRILTYGRDAVGRVAYVQTSLQGQVDDIATNVSYAPFGPLTGFTFGAANSGHTFSRPLDLSYRVTAITDTLLPTPTRQYYYDEEVGEDTVNTENITRIVEQGATQTFGYDVMNRLVSATGPYGNHLYSTSAKPYDGVGNRSSTTIGTTERAYSYELAAGGAGTNRLSTVANGGPTFTYDAAGNALSRNGRTFSYDDDGRPQLLSSSTLLGSADIAYKHNYLGQRVAKAAGIQSVFYVYGPNGELLAELGGSGSSEREYAYLDGMPIAMFTPSVPTDSDGDGMPDAWEALHGLNQNNAADADSNSDGDELTALQEYQAETNPTLQDTDSDGANDGQDPQPTVNSAIWMVPIQREILQ